MRELAGILNALNRSLMWPGICALPKPCMLGHCSAHDATLTIQEAERKSKGVLQEVAEQEYALLCKTHEACHWPHPRRELIDQYRLDGFYDRMQVVK